MTIDNDLVPHVLQFYHKSIFNEVIDYERIAETVDTRTVDGETYYLYECPEQTIILDEDCYAVTYARQKVDIEKNAYYYKFTDDPDIEEDTAFEYVCPYEWKKTHINGEGDLEEE